MAPTDVDAHVALASVYKQHGMPDAAVQEYRAARMLNPSNIYIHRALGLALCQTERVDEAIVELNLIAQDFPLDEDVKLALNAQLQLKKKKRDSL